MPPKQADSSTPIVSQKKGEIWLIVGAVLILIAAALLSMQFNSVGQKGSPTETTLSNGSTFGTSLSTYISNTENIRFEIPEGWTFDKVSKPSLPMGFQASSLILRKTGSACVIVQTKWDPTDSTARKQISFADRVLSNYHQFDGNWMIASSTVSQKYEFSDHVRQYLPGEYRLSYSLRNEPFLLFMSDGAHVPDDCNGDFNLLLESIEPYYEKVSLSISSKGLLTVEKVWDDVTQDGPSKSYEHLIYTADDSGERREVMKIPTDTWTGQFSVFNDKLYVPRNSIYILDPFTASTTQIPGTSQGDTYISSLFLRKGTAYYLANNPAQNTCLTGYGYCPANFYSIPLNGGVATLITQTSIGGSILGYVESENAFYIEQGWGDAGCSSVFINKIIGEREEEVGRFSGCMEEDATENIQYDLMQQKVDALTVKAGASKISSKGIHIENNILRPISGNFESNATFSFDK